MIFDRFRRINTIEGNLKEIEVKLKRVDADIERTREQHRLFLEGEGEVKNPERNIIFKRRNKELFRIRHILEKRYSSLTKEVERKYEKQRARVA